MLKLVYIQICKSKHKVCVKYKHNQKASEGLYPVKNTDVFQNVINIYIYIYIQLRFLK